MPIRKTKKMKRLSFKRAYVSRSQACRLLQVTARDFRRLCILKGIFPREPRTYEHSSGRNKQYFFRKDINWLQHEKVLGKMRDYKVYKRRLTHLLGKKQFLEAAELQKFNKPTMPLSHIIKERYPTFASALRDMDDALSHVALYAILPANTVSGTTIEGHGFLTTGQSKKCRDLMQRWLTYVSKTHSLRKCFISVKGYYFQADVCGESVLWLMPYEFTSKMPKDVDYYAMIAFLEIYTVLVDFVLFKLESMYKKQMQKEEEAEMEKLESEAKGEVVEETPKEILPSATLFSKCVFFIGRENPEKQLRLVIESFGGTVVKDANSNAITHQISDRNVTETRKDRDYVQPQWVFDCANTMKLLHVDPYRPGAKLPAHLSPWDGELHHRVLAKKIEKERAGKAAADDDAESVASNESFEAPKPADDTIVTDTESDDDEDDELSGDEKVAAKKNRKRARDEEKAVAAAAAAALPVEEEAPKKKKAKTQQQEEDLRKKMALQLVSGKKRKLYQYIEKVKKRKTKKESKLAHKYLNMKKRALVE